MCKTKPNTTFINNFRFRGNKRHFNVDFEGFGKNVKPDNQRSQREKEPSRSD